MHINEVICVTGAADSVFIDCYNLQIYFMLVNMFMKKLCYDTIYFAVAQSYHQLTPRLSALNQDCTDY